MLKFEINTQNVSESNIFLRKLWCELNNIRQMGWQLYRIKKERTITIGRSVFGEISYDYEKKGCIKNLYIDNDVETDEITKAVKCALDNDLQNYSISIILENSNAIIAEVASKNVAFIPTQMNTRMIANVQAYSSWDLENTNQNKLITILSLLFEYTHKCFAIKSVQYAKGAISINHTADIAYDYDWIDTDNCPTTKNNSIKLPLDCIELISYVLCKNQFDENIELLLNSSRVLFTIQEIINEVTYPNVAGKADVFNAIACSSFEPLACILDKKVERCNECGNLKYSIVSKVRNLITKYFNDDFAKYLCREIYSNRSTFLHEGRMETTQQSRGIFYPQIDPITKTDILLPHGMVDTNLKDYSSYIFRNIAHDYLHGLLI